MMGVGVAMAGAGTTLAVLGAQAEDTVRNEDGWSQERASNLWESGQQFQTWGIVLAGVGGAAAIAAHARLACRVRTAFAERFEGVDYPLCLDDCSSQSDCRPGYTCWEGEGFRYCFP